MMREENMKRMLVVSLLIILLSVPAAQASLLEDSSLVGRGVAYYLGFIKVYDAALYSPGPVSPKKILDADVSKCLHLEYAVGVEREDFIEAAHTVLERQFADDVIRSVSKSIKELHDGYRDVKEGDSYTLCYNHELETTTLARNNNKVVSIQSAEFSRVYFSIWLGEPEPLDERLRDDLLGIK